MFTHLRTPDFSRLTKTLLGGQADAVPLIELGIHPSIKEALLGRPIVTLGDECDVMRALGYDFVKIQPGIKFEINPATLAGANQPGDMAASSREWAPEGGGMISSWADFERYPWPVRSDIDYRRFEEIRKILPEGMGVIGQYGDIFTVAWELMGFENFAIALYEKPDLVQAVYDRVESLVLSMFETMASLDIVGALWFSDDIAYTAGPMIRPAVLRKLFFPSLKKIGDLAAARKVPFIYHTDGRLWDVMPDILAGGVTALHPIEPKSMDIVEVKRKFPGLCLCGGVEVDLLARGTPEEIQAITRYYLAHVAPGGAWCAGSSNSIPEYVSVPNYRAMLETVLSEGRYS